MVKLYSPSKSLNKRPGIISEILIGQDLNQGVYFLLMHESLNEYIHSKNSLIEYVRHDI